MKNDWSIAEAAALFKVSPRSLYRWLAAAAGEKSQKKRLNVKKVCQWHALLLPSLPTKPGLCHNDTMRDVLRRLATDEDRLLLLKDVAAILNISYSSALDLFRRGELAGIRMKSGNHMIRIFESSVVRLLEECANVADE